MLRFLSLALLLVGGVVGAAPAQDAPTFREKAKKMQGEKSWEFLQSLASSEREEGVEKKLATAYLAVAYAGRQDMAQCVTELQLLRQAGIDLDSDLPGIGAPMVEVVNTVYGHCWANFDPAFNRALWEPVFDAFPRSHYAPVAASRLLMAALKTNDSVATATFESYFQDALTAADQAGDSARHADLAKRYVDGHLRAGHSDARVAALAAGAWKSAWSTAQETHGFEGAPTGGDWSMEQLLARRECELDTDHAFNTLAQATVLAGEPLQVGHPLFDMEVAPSVSFTDITEQVGLGDLTSTRVAAADFDQDGDPDLCFRGRLYANRNGKFTEVGADLGVTRRGSGAFFGDYDGDGDLDLLITAAPHPFLFRNLGKKGKYRFEDATTSSGLDALQLKAGVEGAAWVDFDDDGDLDLYLAVYERDGAQPDALLANQGDGTFVDVSATIGLNQPEPYCARGVSPCDVDLDGTIEILVSNYRLHPNLLWSLTEDHTLNDVSSALGVKGVKQPEDGKYFGHTIGSCWGDVDNDGDLDLFSANLAHPRFVRQGFSNLSLLGIRQDDGNYRDEILTRGIRFQETHSDPAFVDIDNDGDLDLSLTCVYEGVSSALYQNDGQGNFAPITFRANAAMFHGWGQAWLDIDGDGFLDVIFGSDNGVRVLRNSGNKNHFLRLDLRGKGLDPHAFGATVTVTTLEEEVPRSWVRQLHNARGTGSQDEPILHFGLGDYAGKLRVDVRWPDTDRVETKKPKSDRLFVVKQSKKAKAKTKR